MLLRENRNMESNNFNVDIAKELNVTVEKLYNAWTNGAQLKQWWKPMGKNLSEVTNDLKEGGVLKYEFEDNSLVIEGKYIEVKSNERLVYTWNWQLVKDEIRDSTYQLTVEFSGNGNKSRIHILQENFADAEGTVPHKAGWEKGLSDLENFLQADVN